jgi:hypothetical protein
MLKSAAAEKPIKESTYQMVLVSASKFEMIEGATVHTRITMPTARRIRKLMARKAEFTVCRQSPPEYP